MRWDDIDWEATLAPDAQAPPLADLMASGQRRQEAVRYHLTDRLMGAAQVASHHAFRALPADVASGTARLIARPVYRWRYRNESFVRRMDAMIARLRADLAADQPARAALIARWFENTAQTYAEYAKQRSLARSGRTTVTGTEHLEAAKASGRPLIMPFIHTGAWELSLTITAVAPFPGRFTGPWQPQTNRFENRIVSGMRRRIGTKALPPGPGLARSLLRFLSVPGQALVIGIDEMSEGGIQFPLFGRPIPSRCNLSFTVRTAANRDALILPTVLLRTGGARFSLTYHPPIDVAAHGGDRAEAAALALDAIYDPIVRANLDQWYMLHRLRL